MIPNLPHLWFEPHPESPSLRRPTDEGMTAMDRLVLAPRSGAQGPADGRRVTRVSGNRVRPSGVEHTASTGPSGGGA